MNFSKYFKIFSVVSFLVFGLFFTTSAVSANTCHCAVGGEDSGIEGEEIVGREWTVFLSACEADGGCEAACAEGAGGEEITEAECTEDAVANNCICHGTDEDEEVDWIAEGVSCDEGPSEECFEPCAEVAAREIVVSDDNNICVAAGGDAAGSINPPSESPPEETQTETRAAPIRDCQVVNRDCMARFPSQRHIFFSNAECYCCGECTLDDFTNALLGASDYLFGILGALALLFFIYGGVTWLTAGGSPERVDKGRKILIGAVVGIAITIGAWFLIDLLQQALGVKGNFRL
ncbi:hypothetical protein A2316_01250 [Candidatus Falkowbacteria bacterium RIFOXYB2_FULL_38_15]|uniref:DUF4190 domain-containing protein n=1 Tax=Candidatus Falkowbacteria bacterium RIFOXYA2_FULL_38_12 TaxID=1797993 RepID=A0A1F5S4U6_9BACT|nr:MAG: hypothetical protein A2257_02650 [Candidatus Falkowbacteria bacterium RIFOXYA2_FULL_38_12]OGF32807.1 MAG: hypothetical protein A2316_01250 [Candidatus Falkowbacteria bacterium RIFOXYB2_FULL_38_15]OGF42155.1 MAG: hypothetical protein A2555_02635 [Candidatus Falkowbacteria bacterium RIFOXYD2_FULL_39_16]